MIAFGLATALAGLAGVLIGPTQAVDLNLGFGVMLGGFAAAILGGFGSLGGVVVGGFMIGLAEQLVGGYCVRDYKSAYPFVLMILVIAFRPEGLFEAAPWTALSAPPNLVAAERPSPNPADVAAGSARLADARPPARPPAPRPALHVSIASSYSRHGRVLAFGASRQRPGGRGPDATAGSSTAIIVIGFYFVFGVSGQFAFSQAAFAGLGAYTVDVGGQRPPTPSGWASSRPWRHGRHRRCSSRCSCGGPRLLLRHRHARDLDHRPARHPDLERLQRGLRRRESPTIRKMSTLVGHSLSHQRRDVFVLGRGARRIVMVLTVWLQRVALRPRVDRQPRPRTVSTTLGVAVAPAAGHVFVLGSVARRPGRLVFAHWKGVLGPDDWSVDLGLGIFLMLILGGIGSRWGASSGRVLHVRPAVASDAVFGISVIDFTSPLFGQELRSIATSRSSSARCWSSR